MPRRGVPGETDDEDDDTGALRALACPRHRGDSGGRKLPPPTVRQVRHSGPPEGAEWASPGDRAVCERSRGEETAAGRDRDEGKLGAGFRSIWGTDRVGVGIQILGEDPDGDRRQLVGGGRKSQEGEAKLGAAVQGA